MHARRRLALVLPLLVTATACSTYSTRRAALVPHHAPRAWSGQPLGGQAGVELGAATTPAIAGGDAQSGVHVPSVDVGGAFRVRTAVPGLELGLVYDQGLAGDAHTVDGDVPTPGGRDVVGAGVTAQVTTLPTRGDGAGFGLTAELLSYSVPYVEYRTCIEYCETMATHTTVERGRELIPVVSVGVVPMLRRGALTFFGGLTLRNHPTIDQGGIEGERLFGDAGDDVRAGSFSAIASGGAEVTLGGGVRALAHVYQPLGTQPIRYLPSVGMSLSVPLGRTAP